MLFCRGGRDEEGYAAPSADAAGIAGTLSVPASISRPSGALPSCAAALRQPLLTGWRELLAIKEEAVKAGKLADRLEAWAVSWVGGVWASGDHVASPMQPCVLPARLQLRRGGCTHGCLFACPGTHRPCLGSPEAMATAKQVQASQQV